MGKDIDWEAIRREFPEVDLSPAGVAAFDENLRRLLAYRPRDSGRLPKGRDNEDWRGA